MKSGEKYNNSRRHFIKSIGTTLLLVPFWNACKNKVVQLLLNLTKTNHLLGHRLWTQNFPNPTATIKTKYLIVGGGITGLSAARHLTQKGENDFLIIELEKHLGGNAASGQNDYSKYPLGAHYLPLPNLDDKNLIDFLHEEQIITGFDAENIPNFDETQLCLAPQERLFFKNEWQEDLIPKFGLTVYEKGAFDRFFDLMKTFRDAKGHDQKYHFYIPISDKSSDTKYEYLDGLTMKNWLLSQNLNANTLLVYIDYCCRDDFGLGIECVSAWAGIHYFAARKTDQYNQKYDAVLTWPEGNAKLAQLLQKYTTQKSLKQHVVYHVSIQNGQGIAKVYDDAKNISKTIIADKIIMATPQFVNQYLIDDRKSLAQNFVYAPWLLATLVIDNDLDTTGFPLAWDNVIHGANGLGYVYDQHQNLNQTEKYKVITYYYSFSDSNTKNSRKKLYQNSKEYWTQMVFDDLKIAHTHIEAITKSIDIHLIGHGMISPIPGFILGKNIQKAAQPIQKTIYFAHSDLSGISIFEEAFHQGINIVNRIIHDTALDKKP